MEVICELTELSSRWSGRLELVLDADFKGKKPFRCDILLDATLATQQERWSTLIHEALHSLSAGYLRDDYQDFQGWEEGVVEKLQRLLRPQVLTRLGVNIPEATFLPMDEGHSYNDFITALESLRQIVGISDAISDVQEFYVHLLSTPIRNRPALLLSLGMKLQGEARRQFITLFASANAALRTRRPQGNLTP